MPDKAGIKEEKADHKTCILDDSGLEARTAETNSSNIFLRLIQQHYRVDPPVKTEEQLNREKWLLPKIPYNRWHSIPAAVIIQFCCGSMYAWSVFNKPIDTLIYGENRNVAPIAFYVCVAFFGLSASVLGPKVTVMGPARSAILGTTLFFLGNLLTALALYLHQMWLVFVGAGAVTGFGLGLSYISPISALQQWFPDKRGLASGFAVCGFGAGSIAVGKAIIPLIKLVELPLTFVILGSCYFVLMVLSALILRTPPPNYTGPVGDSTGQINNNEKNNKDYASKDSEKVYNTTIVTIKKEGEERNLSLIECITSKDFRLMYVMFLANAIFGLVVVSRLSNMITDIFGRSAEEASTIVSINGGFNLGGRLAFSIVSDYLGRKSCYTIMLTLQLIIVAVFSTITTSQTYWAFLVSIWILTACYGAGFGVIPAFLTDRFGPQNIGACHGIILTAWSLAGVAGGLIYTYVFDQIVASGVSPKDPYPYNVNSWWILGVILIGWIALLFVHPTENDSRISKKIRNFFRIFNCCRRGMRTYDMKASSNF